MEGDSKKIIRNFISNGGVKLHFRVDSDGEEGYDIFQSSDKENWKHVHSCKTLREVEEFQSNVTGIYLNQLNFLSDILGKNK
jgi:hypothetical protein